MIKQIQLRGISRTPSDRMSEDGGLSESLNMYLDTAENAPAFVPEDITTKLGLPADLVAERIFIHKTANYENYIVVQEGRIVAYTPGIEDEEPLLVMELTADESVGEINSMGNTLIISTTKNPYYVLYKNGAYVYIGNNVPFPMIHFTAKKATDKYFKFGDITNADSNAWLSGEISKDDWNQDYEKDNLSHSSEKINALLNILWSAVDAAMADVIDSDYMFGEVVLRYAIELYDGSKISSMPILLGVGYRDEMTTTLNIYQERLTSPGGTSAGTTTVKQQKYSYRIEFPFYQIFAQIEQGFAWDDWSDIISSINIYMSKFPISPQNRNMSYITFQTITQEDIDAYDSNYTIRRTLRLGDKQDAELINNILTSSAHTYLVNQTYYNNVPSKEGLRVLRDELQSGTILKLSRLSGITFETLQQLERDDMKHYAMLPLKIKSYNAQLLFIQPVQVIDYGYDRLNAYDIVTHEASDKPVTWVTYDVTYMLRGAKEDKVIKKQFTYTYSVFGTERIYAFQIFPDSRAYKMIVKATKQESGVNGTTEIKYGEFDMLPHPYLDCAYYYGGIENELVDLCTLPSAKDYPVNVIDSLENKLMVSKQDNPFVFPLEHRFTFQSKVIGVAIATTTLSQGQFGQFPLAVFTEDGIWMMQANEEGELRGSKPKFRDVCINPDSITSIDDAIVFITARGVMMIQNASRVQEAQVVCISPYMNGRHYTPNESALNIIGKQEGFEVFTDVISDDDPFMSFMKDAKVAYDYTGQRLIFISPSNRGFQYVYKIDTQTWHKVAFEGLNLDTPLNSYPECLVFGNDEGRFLVPADIEIKTMQLLGLEPQYDTEYFRNTLWNKEQFLLKWNNDASFVEELEEMGWSVRQSEDNRTHIILLTNITCVSAPTMEAQRRRLMDTLQCSSAQLDGMIDGTLTEKSVSWLESRLEENEAYLSYFFSYDKGGEIVQHNVKAILEDFSGEKEYLKGVYSLSTVIDAKPDPENPQKAAKGILITRPFDLGMPDVYKSITNIKIRGNFDKGNVKYILQGSNDGRTFYTLNTLRGKSWRMFRIFILAELEPTERISWIDVDFEPRYNTKLR